MAKLWKLWWFRALMGVLATPFITTAVALAIVFVFSLLNSGDMFGGSDVNYVFSLFFFYALAEIVLAIPPWIVMEVGNRRRGRPLPPELTAAWIALSSGFFVALLLSSSLLASWLQGAVLVIAFVFTCYVAGIILGWLALTPFIMRWQQTAARDVDSSELF